MITETLNNCDADTMTDSMGTLKVYAISSQTESLMTSFYYEFESMSTHEQTSLIQTIYAADRQSHHPRPLSKILLHPWCTFTGGKRVM